MADIQTIVEKLNEPPFEKGLSLVALDEISQRPMELITLLNDVFKAMDSRHSVDLRDENDDARAYRFMEFLQLLKYPGLPAADGMENYRDALKEGDRGAIYPILYWVLSDFSKNSKRAYLARFLAPTAVPAEYLAQDEALNELNVHFRQLQEEFKQIHRQADQMHSTKVIPTEELKQEVAQLDLEKTQLHDKIANLKKKTQNLDGFPELLQATSSLRKEQEEEAKAMERQRDQRIALQQAERRYQELVRRLQEAKTTSTSTVDAEILLNRLSREVEENRLLLTSHFPTEIRQRQERLHRLEQMMMEPTKTEGDLAEVEDEIIRTEKTIEALNEKISATQKATGDDKLAVFRQQSNVVAKKLQGKEEQLDKLLQQLDKLSRDIELREHRLSEISGPKYMKKEDFKKFANELRNKTNVYKSLKAELSEIQAETVILARTQQIIKSRATDLDDFLEKLEMKRGVTGYMETQQKLEAVSEANSLVNQTKGKTLEEISKIVTDINQVLKERKTKLAPQIKELKSVRQTFQDIEQQYLEKKTTYENTALGLETERMKLEQECDAFQEDCLREESRYHFLNALSIITDTVYEKASAEAQFDKGEGKFLRDFATYKHFYQSKIQQQELLSKELRRQQKEIKESEMGNSDQVKMFQDLRRLLQGKVKVLNQMKAEMNRANIDQLDLGGANVMTIASDDTEVP